MLGWWSHGAAGADLRMKTAQRAQVLVFFALVMPIVLLPVAAYAVDASVTSAAFAQLQEATVEASEAAAQQIDTRTLRSGGGIALDIAAATSVARDAMLATDPHARLIAVTVAGISVSVSTAQQVDLPLNFLGSPAVTVRALAVARLVQGYGSPSSFLPLPFNTF
jgi:hypothetical protein